MEAEAVFTVQQVAATAFLLYMCKLRRVPDCRECTVPDANFQQPPLPSTWSARSSKLLRQSCRTDRILPRNPLIVVPCNEYPARRI